MTATDPSGDSDTVTVIVIVEDENDPLKLNGPKSQHYEEDSTEAVATFKATDEDPNETGTYTLVQTIGDHAVFTIDSLTGALTFKGNRPNYELPEDMEITGNTNEAETYNSDAGDNLYIVAVRAKVPGTPDPTADAVKPTSFAQVDSWPPTTSTRSTWCIESSKLGCSTRMSHRCSPRMRIP